MEAHGTDADGEEHGSNGGGGVLGVSFLRARGGELEKQPLLTGGAAHGYWVAGDR